MQPVTIPQAVFLAGGRGSRLGALTDATAKPVLEVGGRPFLYWPMRELQRFGVERFLVLTGYRAEATEAAVQAAAAALPRPAGLRFVREDVARGTGGALLAAAAALEPRFLLLNADTLFDTNWSVLLAAAAAQPAAWVGRLLLRRVPDTGRYGGVALADGRVTAFLPAPDGAAADAASAADPGAAEDAGGALIHAGGAVFDRRVLAWLTPGGSLERETLPALAAAGLLGGTAAAGWFIDIGVPAALAAARAALPARLRRRALVLDRDGVLNIDHGYVGGRDRWQWVDGAQAAVAQATARGWHVFVATNQSGIARGLYDETAMRDLHAWVADALRAAGGTIDDWRHCPYHPEATVARWRRTSDWRKPGPGMLLDLARAWSLDPARCVMLGDQPTDLAAAAAAGMAGVRFAGGRLDMAVSALLDEAAAE